MTLRHFLVLCFALIVGGCSSSDLGYEGTYTSMIGSKATDSATSGYGLAAKKVRKSRYRKPYFIEFRARNALTYGHAFVVFGVRDKNGRVPTLKKPLKKDTNGLDIKGPVLDPRYVEIAGLHPASNSPVPWTIGHVIPVPAETGPSDGDFEERYVTARYKINLTKAEFKKVVEQIKLHKKQGVFWSAPAYACVHFIAAISRDLGLKNPRGLKLPQAWVEELKRLNGKNPRLDIKHRPIQKPA